jgi:hypothetical protein
MSFTLPTCSRTVGKPIDVGRRSLLGDAHEQRVVEARIIAAERVTRMDA